MIKSRSTTLAVGPHAVTHGGSIPGCEFSLPRHFHDGSCPEWQPCSCRQMVGDFLRAGRGTGPDLGAELGNIPHLHAEWLRAVSGAPSSVLVLPAFLHTCPAPPPALSAVVSALLFRPPVPVPFASQRAASCLFLLQVSAALGVPASSPPWLLFWGCCAQGWLAGPHLSGALYQAKFW